MARAGSKLVSSAVHHRTLARWQKASREAPGMDLDLLRHRRQQARTLKGPLDELIHVADSRLGLPRIGSSAFPRPAGTEWAWRPQLWRGPLAQKGLSGAPTKTRLGDEVTLFHDCKISELTLRQVRNHREEDLAPYAMRMDVFRFDGSFLSLALDLPEIATDGLLRKHIIRLSTIIETEKEIEVFARLNIRHGPNTEQAVLEVPINRSESVVEFDLAYTDMNEKRVEKLWLDLIFEGPEMNQVTIRDLTFARYPRAAL